MTTKILIEVEHDSSCDFEKNFDGNLRGFFWRILDPTQAVPDAVLSALARMDTPLHESDLRGATADCDARDMKIIGDFIRAHIAAP